jgi:hypothetical protein
MGIPGQYDNPAYQDAVTKIIAVGKKAGKPIGIGGIGPRLDLLEKFFAVGTSWSLSGGDIAMLQGGMQKLGSTYVDLNAKYRRHEARVKIPKHRCIKLVASFFIVLTHTSIFLYLFYRVSTLYRFP